MYNENKRKQKFGFQVLILLASVSMIIGLAVGGTMAWLTDKTQDVKNTFTTSDVDIELAETTGDSYQMIPGHTITKDPKVTVKADSEKCYVFVQVVESTTTYSVNGTDKGFDDYLTYDVDTTAEEGKTGDYYKWTAGDGTGEGKNGVPVGVWFRVVDDTDADQEFNILKDNKVTVKDTVTKAMMDAITVISEQTAGNEPTLTFTAYACQYMKNNTENFTAAEAWNNVPKS